MPAPSSRKPAYHSHLTVADGRLPYAVYLSRRRTLSLQCRRDGSVVVRAPLRMSAAVIDAFVRDKRAWIERQLARIASLPERRQPHYVDGAMHAYRGQWYCLRVLSGQRGRGWLEDDEIRLPCADDEPATVERRLIEWYRQQARDHFPQRLQQCWPAFADLGLSQPSLRIRRMKSLWGSLARRRVMTLNLSLIQTTDSGIDYVITHELCHLLHHHHGPEFHALMDRVMPDWRQRKRQLTALL